MRTGNARILVVDDRPANLHLLGRILKTENFDARLLPNGVMALSSAQTEPPDLILLDIRMPGMDGFEVCRRLKADGRTRNIPVIFISALTDTRDKVEALSLGGVDFISKPFQAEEILARIRVHLNIRSLQDRLVTSNAELTVANAQLSHEITERRRVEGALKASEELHRTTLGSISDAVFVTDDTGAFTFVCQNANVIFGYSFEEVLQFGDISKLLGEIVFDRDELDKAGELPNLDHEITDKYGNPHDLLINVKRVSINGGTTLYTCRDITERRVMEKQIVKYQKKLRLLHSEMLNVEEQERYKIASELHDNVGQKLAFLKMKLGALRETASSCGFAGALDEINQLTGQIIDTTRSLIFETRPPMLSELGLVSAVEWLVDEFQSQHGIEIVCCHDTLPEITDEHFKLLLFRALRELLFNIAKHARVRHAEIALAREADNIRMVVRDKGVGFDLSELESGVMYTRGFGLFSIRERLRNVGGKLGIESEPGKGVKVTLTAPLPVGKDAVSVSDPHMPRFERNQSNP